MFFEDKLFDLVFGGTLYNSGYFLLGYIVEKVSGESFADYLKNSFFEPLGMDNTGIHHWKPILEHEATGYSYENGNDYKHTDPNGTSKMSRRAKTWQKIGRSTRL